MAPVASKYEEKKAVSEFAAQHLASSTLFSKSVHPAKKIGAVKADEIILTPKDPQFATILNGMRDICTKIADKEKGVV